MTKRNLQKIICILLLVLPGWLLSAGNGAVIVMDAETGEILYLENPGLAIENSYSPGSLLKPFSAVYGLKKGIISPGQSIDCPGHTMVEGERLECWHRDGHGSLNLYKALAYSCNVYFYQISNRYDIPGFLDFLRQVGFGQKTGIDLPNEHAGTIPDALTTLEKTKLIAGNSTGIQVTPLQVVVAFAALVNGGKLLKPFWQNRKVQIQGDLNIAGQLPVIQRSLKEASTYGTSAGYYSETGGFAKTGTSPWLEGYHTHGWFVGYLPLRNRKIVLLVFQYKGTGTKDAFPTGMELAKKMIKNTRDEQEIRVSLFSLLKPKTVSVKGRFGLLSIETGEGEPISSRSVNIKHLSDGSIKVSINEKNNREARTYHSLEIRSTHVKSFLAVRAGETGNREYRGRLTIRSNGHYLEIINTVTLREYIAGVILNEINNHSEALKSQAVLSRTYALKNRGRHDGFDFCDTTHCQHYTGIYKNPAAVDRAVKETGGLVLVYKDRMCNVFFHSTCGGRTSDYKGIWEDREIPYLKSLDDNELCRISPHFRWQLEIGEKRLLAILKDIAGVPVVDFRIVETGTGGWVKRVALISAGGREKILRGEEFHIHMGRCLGWSAFKSANFTISKNGTKWVFTGKGLGHGLGLCQWGARVMAEQGMGFTDILSFYFPGTRVKDYWMVHDEH